MKTRTEIVTVAELFQEELDAINEYLKGLDKKCTYKVETYAERTARRQDEINGLKESLEVIESETAEAEPAAEAAPAEGAPAEAAPAEAAPAEALVQTASRALRGVHKHA